MAARPVFLRLLRRAWSRQQFDCGLHYAAIVRVDKALPERPGWRSPSGAVEQAVLDQRGRAAIPGIIRADAKIALSRHDERAGMGVADMELYRVFRPADPPHDTDKGLIGAELLRDGGVAAVALPQRAAFHGIAFRIRDVDKAIAAGLRDQPARFAGGPIQLHEVGGMVIGNSGAAAEIVEFEIKYRDLDRRRFGICRHRRRRAARDDLVRDEGFGPAPGVIGVAAKGEELDEHHPPGAGVDGLDLRVLHQRAHLVDAANQQDVRAGFAGCSHKIADRHAGKRARTGGASRRDDPEAAALREIALEGAHEGFQPRFMLPALIALLARGVDIVEVDHRDPGDLRGVCTGFGVRGSRREPQAERQHWKNEKTHGDSSRFAFTLRQHGRPDKRTRPGAGRANCPIFRPTLPPGGLRL